MKPKGIIQHPPTSASPDSTPVTQPQLQTNTFLADLLGCLSMSKNAIAKIGYISEPGLLGSFIFFVGFLRTTPEEIQRQQQIYHTQ
jgi:hypothetical protein